MVSPWPVCPQKLGWMPIENARRKPKTQFATWPSGMIIIDGGIGSEISGQGVPLSPCFWSATAHITHPDLVTGIHRRYLEAGADVVSTNTFMAGRHILAAGGIKDFEQVNYKAVEVARAARIEAGKASVLIAGCMSVLAGLDRASAFPRGKQVRKNYVDQAHILVDSGADVLLAEMLTDARSANDLLEACCLTGVPVWAGLSACRVEGKPDLMAFRRPGAYTEEAHETFEEVLSVVSCFDLDALGVMHTDVGLMPEALVSVRDKWSGKLLAYAKTGEATQPDWSFEGVMPVEEYTSQVADWTQQYGLDIVGGCCGFGPEHIRALADCFR